LWCEQGLALAESHELVEHPTIADLAYAKYTTPTSNIDVENIVVTLTNSFKAWCKSDHLPRGWIIGTLSKEAIGVIVGLETSYSVWETPKNSYAQDSQEQEFTL